MPLYAHMKPYRPILEVLSKNKDAAPFWNPVTKKYNPAYYSGPKKVASPIDLSEVSDRLLSGQYQDGAAFKEDIDRVWTNCVTYNGEDARISQVALRLKTFVDERMEYAMIESNRLLTRLKKEQENRETLRKEKILMRRLSLLQRMGMGQKKPPLPPISLSTRQYQDVEGLAKKFMSVFKRGDADPYLKKAMKEVLEKDHHYIEASRSKGSAYGSSSTEVAWDMHKLDDKTLWNIDDILRSFVRK